MRRSMVLVAVLALAVAACGSTDTTETTTDQAQSTATAAPPTTEAQATPTTQADPVGMVVSVADSPLGTILVDGEGNTLYLFTPDEQGDSVCYDQCEAAWPPLTADVTAADGVDAALLGSAPRTDGTEQVTYNGWPLYYFASDTSPGDVNGQGLNDVWFVVDPTGAAVGLDG